MITEPEPIGDGLPEAAPGGPEPDLVQGAFAPWAGERRVRPPWLWGAVGGAAAASAVWTALLLVGLGPFQDNRPDLHGYRINGSPCRTTVFAPLSRAVAATGTNASVASIVRGTAVDRAHCTFSARVAPAVGWTASYDVDLSVDLHKLADTRQEFEQEHAFDSSTLTIADSATKVTGLGDEAYALTFTDQAEELKVLRGGAVVTLRLTAHTFWSGSQYGPGPGSSAADPATAPRTRPLPALRPALAATARTLLASLRDR